MTALKLTPEESALIVVLRDYIRSAAGSGAPTTAKGTAKKATTEKKPKFDKKKLAEMTSEAKQLGAKILNDFDKDTLAGLLGDVGADKFTDIKETKQLEAFMFSAKALIEEEPAGGEDDDLLGDSADEEVERTFDDVKNKLLEINNHEKLGKEVTKEILGELGIQRLPQLKQEKYNEAYDAAEKALNDA